MTSASMTCARFQDEALLHFGENSLPEAMTAHLEQCPACREFWNELSATAAAMPEDEDFFPSELELNSAVAGVETRLDDLTPKAADQPDDTVVVSLRERVLRALPAAAAVMLMLTVGYNSYLSEIGVSDTAETASAVIFDLSDITEASTQEELFAPSDEAFSALLYDFTTTASTDASEQLLDDLTAEELQYLEDNLDVGDILL